MLFFKFQRAALLLCTLFLAALVSAAPEFKETSWDELMPADFDPNTMYNELDFASYDIVTLDDSDPEAQRLLADLMIINASAPMVDELEGKNVKIPGFIVPLEMNEDKVLSFFLVPYFGACIHTPPPSANQMVYVETTGIKLRSLDEPVWVSGEITLESVDNELGMAGYTIRTDIVDSYY